jgi:hypothetical protein
MVALPRLGYLGDEESRSEILDNQGVGQIFSNAVNQEQDDKIVNY